MSRMLREKALNCVADFGGLRGSRWAVYGHLMRVVVTIVLGLVACQAPRPRSEPPGDPGVAIFTYARPFIAREELPARFSAPLPHTVVALADTGRYPPEGLIAAALDRGDADMQARVGDALRKVAARGALPAALAAFYDRVYGARPSPAACNLLKAQVSGDAPGMVRAIFWSALARCRGSRYAAAFARADAPDRAVVRWYALATDELSFTPRLGEAARKVARRGPLEAREVGDALAHVEGRRAVRAVRELQQQLRDPERRALVAVGLARRPEKAARALVRRACNHPRVRFDDACSSLGRARFHLDGDVRATDSDDQWLLVAHGKVAVVDALDRCVVDGEWDDERALCLRRLARLDWERAAAVAVSIQESLAASSPLADPVGPLVRFPEPGEIVAELREASLIAGEERATGAVSPAGILLAYERAVRFDIEAGVLAEQHGQLMLDLAVLVRPDLDGFAFEAATTSARGPFRLRAWGDDRLFEVAAGRRTNWPDVPAVVGLLNCLLRAGGSEKRFLAVAGGGRFVTVVGASGAAIEAAVAAGIVEPR